MWLTIVRIQDGKRRILWPEYLLFVGTCFATTIGSAELFWRLFSGGFSPLVGLLAAFVARGGIDQELRNYAVERRIEVSRDAYALFLFHPR